MKNEVKKFEVGKTYYRIANDDSAAWKVLYKVTKRTEKTAIFEDVDGEVFKKKIYADMGEAEAVMIGKTQIISASDVADEETAQKVIPVENETDGSEDDDEEENVAMTIDYNFDVEEEDDDELIDEAEAANLEVDVTEYAVSPDAQEVAVLAEIENAARVSKAGYLVKSMSKYGAWATFKYETLQDAARSVAGIFDKEYYRGEVAVEVTNFQSDVLYSWELAGKNFPTLTEIETALHISADLETQSEEVAVKFEVGKSYIGNSIYTGNKTMFTVTGRTKNFVKFFKTRTKIYVFGNSECVNYDGYVIRAQNAADVQEEVAVKEVMADLEKHFKKVQDDLEIQQISIELDEEIIKRKQKRSLDLAAWMTQNENEIYELLAKKIDSEKAVKNLTVAVEELQAEITNRKLNAAAVGMVDDGTNEEDAETLTVDYNFDVEEDDDELVDPPIEYHIEIPAALELEPVTFAIERFGDEDTEFDAKTKELVDAHKSYCKSVDEIDKQISELETQLEALKEEREKRKDARFNNWYDNGRLKSQNSYLKAYIAANVHISADTEIILQGEYGTSTLFEGIELGATLTPPNGEIRMWTYKGTTATLVYYKSFEEFKAAIEGLVAAIERGDEVYTFPADNALVEVPAVVEKVPTLDEDARIKEIASEITAIGAKIEDWLDNRDAKMDELRKYLDNVEEWAFKKVHGTGDDAWKIILVTPDKKKMCLVKNKDSISLDGVTFQVSYRTWNHVAMIDAGICSKTHAVIYDTISEFKAAIEKIVTAINAGKKSVTLPTPTDAEKNAKK